MVCRQHAPHDYPCTSGNAAMRRLVAPYGINSISSSGSLVACGPASMGPAELSFNPQLGIRRPCTRRRTGAVSGAKGGTATEWAFTCTPAAGCCGSRKQPVIPRRRRVDLPVGVRQFAAHTAASARPCAGQTAAGRGRSRPAPGARAPCARCMRQVNLDACRPACHSRSIREKVPALRRARGLPVTSDLRALRPSRDAQQQREARRLGRGSP